MVDGEVMWQGQTSWGYEQYSSTSITAGRGEQPYHAIRKPVHQYLQGSCHMGTHVTYSMGWMVKQDCHVDNHNESISRSSGASSASPLCCQAHKSNDVSSMMVQIEITHAGVSKLLLNTLGEKGRLPRSIAHLVTPEQQEQYLHPTEDTRGTVGSTGVSITGTTAAAAAGAAGGFFFGSSKTGEGLVAAGNGVANAAAGGGGEGGTGEVELTGRQQAAGAAAAGPGEIEGIQRVVVNPGGARKTDSVDLALVTH